MAGWDWLRGFLIRHPGISVRKEKNLSINRAVGMNRDDVSSLFDLLDTQIKKLDLLNKHKGIFTLNQSVFHLNTQSDYWS